MASTESGSGGSIPLVAAALGAITNTEIVTKDEYYVREKRARSGIGQRYNFKGSLDLPRAIKHTYATTEKLLTESYPPSVRSEITIKLAVRKEKKSSIGPKSILLLGTGSAVVGMVAAAATTLGAAVVIVTAPVSVPILIGSAVVIGGGAVGVATASTVSITATAVAAKKLIENANSDTSDGRERFVTMPSEEDTILQLKLRIREEFGIEPEDQCLSFCGILLDDTDTLAHRNITNNSTIKLYVRGESVDLFYLDDKYLDSRWDYDFTNIDDGDTKFMRGGHRYHRPCGWNRIAIKVLKKYPDGEAWLGKNGSPGEWAVTYHGTTKGAFNGICEEGIKIGHINKYGRGVYSASHIKIAEIYATMFSHGGIMYKGVFQNRVNPKDMEIPIGQPDYRICRNEASIRPYGLCVKKV